MDGKASDFIHGQLWTLNVPVNIYTDPDSARIKQTVPKNSYVGTIYSWAVRNGSDVWWNIDRNDAHYGWVKHESGVFSEPKLLESLIKYYENEQEEIDRKVEERTSKKWNNLSDWFKEIFSGTFGTIALTVLLILVLLIILKTSKKG